MKKYIIISSENLEKENCKKRLENKKQLVLTIK